MILEYEPEIMLFLLWVIVVYFLHVINRAYVPVALILGLSQFVLVGHYVLNNEVNYGFADQSMFNNMWLVIAFGFLLYSFWKTYKGFD